MSVGPLGTVSKDAGFHHLITNSWPWYKNWCEFPLSNPRKLQTHLKDRYSRSEFLRCTFVRQFQHSKFTYSWPPFRLITSSTTEYDCMSFEYKFTRVCYIWLIMQAVWWVHILQKFKKILDLKTHSADGLQSVPQWESAFNYLNPWPIASNQGVWVRRGLTVYTKYIEYTIYIYIIVRVMRHYRCKKKVLKKPTRGLRQCRHVVPTLVSVLLWHHL